MTEDWTTDDSVTIGYLQRICRLIENKSFPCTVCRKPVVNVTTQSGHRFRFDATAQLAHEVIIPAGNPFSLELKPGVLRSAHYKTCRGSRSGEYREPTDSEWLLAKMSRHPDWPDPTDVPEWDPAN